MLKVKKATLRTEKKGGDKIKSVGQWRNPLEDPGDEGPPDGRRLLPQKHREGRTMRIWSGVSHPIIIQPCHLKTAIKLWLLKFKKNKKTHYTITALHQSICNVFPDRGNICITYEESFVMRCATDSLKINKRTSGRVFFS